MHDLRPVTIVIPSYNQLHLLPACLESIRRHTRHPDVQTIVVDLGSTDGSRDLLERVEGIQVIHHSDRSVVSGLNRAFAQAHGRDVVRLHPEVVVETDGWLTRLLETARDRPTAGAIGAKLVFPDGRLHSVGRSILSGTGIWERHANRRSYELDPGPVGEPEEVDTVSGAFAYYRREMLNATGGLDERYWPGGLDEDDLCLMARHTGFQVYVDPQVAGVYHEPSWSPTTSSWVPHPQRLPEKAITLKRAVIDSQAEAFRQKWSFDPRFPDLGEIRRLYGATEICWRIGERMRFRPKEWPPSVDAVLVTWNNRETLQRCLESLARTRYDHERLTVYVTDNGSQDGSVEYLESLSHAYPFRLVVSPLPINSGVAVGMNWSIVQGHGELVARLDDDVELPPEWLEVLVEDLRRRPFAGVVGPKIINDSTTNDIQCAGYRMFPGVYGHDGEPDQGQADYLARCVHVRGCCNLYRRDVLEDCGHFDLRYSPSQADDPDHHIALAARGYEVLYDGRVRVIHSLTNGAMRTHSALSNQRCNVDKIYGKWGGDIYRILDQSIELSQEGRYLPDDGDTSAFQATLPDPTTFPRLSWTRDPSLEKKRRKILGFHERVFGPGGELEAHLADTIDLARFRTRDGHHAHAALILHTAVDLQPFNVEALRELGDAYQRLGQPERAQLLWRRALALLPSNGREDLEARLSGQHEIDPPVLPALGGVTRGPADRSAFIGEEFEEPVQVEVEGSLRVLMVNTFEPRVPGGDMVQIKKTREHLQRLGVQVDVSYATRPDPRGYDLVHVFNLWFPHQTLAQIKAIRVQAPEIPIVLSPIYWDMSEKSWAENAVPQTIGAAKTPQDLERRLEAIAKGLVPINGKTRSEIQEPDYFRMYQREILARVDHLLPLSHREMQVMQKALGGTPDYTVVRNAAEVEVFDRTSGDWFEQEYGIRDFVICVGLIEPRKNQLMLMQALQGLGVPAVVVGRNYDRGYLRQCQDFAPEGTIFIEHLPHDRLASALKAARVFCLPSWMECASLANIEAALAGCGLALSNRTSEPEYFEDGAYYCDPGDVDSIRQAIARAYTHYDADAPKRQRLRERFTREWTWERAAHDTMAGYQKAIEARRGSAALIGR